GCSRDNRGELTDRPISDSRPDAPARAAHGRSCRAPRAPSAAQARRVAPRAAGHRGALGARCWERVRRAVAALLAQNVDALPHLTTSASPEAPRRRSGGKTVREFYGEWIETKPGQVRPALLRDYRRHFARYILADPLIADVSLADLRPMDLQLFQSRLRL